MSEAIAWERKMQLRTLTVPQLRTLAKELGLRRYSALKKNDLVAMIESEVEGLSDAEIQGLSRLLDDDIRRD
mgnify:CR=1 FL=1